MTRFSYRKNFWLLRQRPFWQGRAAAKWLKYDRPARWTGFALPPGMGYHTGGFFTAPAEKPDFNPDRITE
ncbi:MAG: hypothetical protein D6796_14930 [Caldilineae bacterium]|nr:MAG: hypothetical protein D6796_14930 [Caldilineae bacterium]